MAREPGAGLMTLGDVAELAGVRRPVVSTWRRRQVVTGQHCPFPSPVSVDRGRDLFRAEDVLDWLELTGRGNNPQARADAVAHVSRPPTPTGGAPALSALTSLLGLKAVTDATLSALDAEELLDLADEVDPDDDFLFREIEQLGSGAGPLATYIDELTDAAYDPSGALDRLLDQDSDARSTAARATALAPAVHDLVGALASSFANDLEAGSVTIVDATGGVNPLLGAVVGAMGDHLDCAVQVSGDDEAARGTRRVGNIRGWSLTRLSTPDDPAVVIAQLPNAARPSMTTADVLTAIDDLQLELGEGQRAVILAPAAVLCDRLGDSALDGERDHLVRLGRLRFVGRLPQGLLLGRSRQSLGLWTLGSDEAARIEDRWVAAADLTDIPLTPDVIDDLVTDVVTAMGPRALGRAHAFRFARVSHTAPLLAGRGALVPAGVRPGRVAPTLASEKAVQARRLIDGLAMAPTDEAMDLRVAAAVAPDAQVGAIVLAQAVDQRLARVLPGTRMAVEDVAPGTVRLFTADDLAEQAGQPSAGLDPLDLEARYPRIRRTEPGDVVFCTSPRPRAVVDRDGLSVVAYPARVLRCGAGSGLLPEAVALAVNALPPTSRHWRTWRMPVVPASETTRLGESLRRIAAEKDAARGRIERLDELAEVLVTGVASGALSIEPPNQSAPPVQTSPTTTEEGH